MIANWFTNRWVLYAFCAVFTFIEMIGAKYAYLSWTKKIENEKVRVATNLVCGFALCVLLSAIQMWALCDVFGGIFYWKFVIAAAGTATGAYLVYEKIFGNSENTLLGKVFREVLNNSGLFEGKISSKNAVKLANLLRDRIAELDKKVADRENKGLNTVVSLLGTVIADGKVDEEEKKEVEKVVAGFDANDLAKNETYQKYVSILKK